MEFVVLSLAAKGCFAMFLLGSMYGMEYYYERN